MDYWVKQTKDQPLFPDLLWSRPENKAHAGKLLIVGGNLHGFSAPASAYQASLKAGIGSVRVLLPDSLRKTVGKVLDVGEYAPSTPSGSFSQKALAELLEHSAWADGVLLAGDFGRNSETALLIEKLMQKYSGQLTIVQDSLELISISPAGFPARQNTCVVATIAQLQRILTSCKWPQAITMDMPLGQLVNVLRDFTIEYPLTVVTKQNEMILVACAGQISSTKTDTGLDSWRIATAASASVWWLQNPEKPFESITSSLI